MGREDPLRVYSSGGKRIVVDNAETPDTQVTVFDFPNYTLIFEHELLGGVGIGGRPHGMSFSGSEGTVIIDGNGWEVVREPNKTLVPSKKEADGDGRPAHVRNFLDCVKSRQQPVENLEVGHFVSTVAHLGNIAYLTKRQIEWDAKKESVRGDREANSLVAANYRKPWKLPA
jgi:predicted dehydrogenase